MNSWFTRVNNIHVKHYEYRFMRAFAPEDFCMKMDACAEKAMCLVREGNIKKYETTEGYEIVCRIKFCGRSFSINSETSKDMVRRCAVKAFSSIEHSMDMAGTESCMTALFEYCAVELEAISHLQNRIEQTQCERKPDLARVIAAKKKAVAKKRKENSINRLAKFMASYKGHVFSKKEAVQACKLAAVMKVNRE